MDIFAGFSEDGVHWNINPDPIVFEGEKDVVRKEYRYDPGSALLRTVITSLGATAITDPLLASAIPLFQDLLSAGKCLFAPATSNGVPFPKRSMEICNGQPSQRYGLHALRRYLLQREPDLDSLFWGKHRYVFGTVSAGSLRKWARPTPIETDEGWLMIYHGVLNSATAFCLPSPAWPFWDIDRPWIVKERGNFMFWAGGAV